MTTFPLNAHLQLVVELDGKSLRFILKDNSEELACRKERISVIEVFLKTKRAEIFKGRLQMKTENNRVQIFLKTSLMGSISKARLADVVSQMKTAVPQQQ